ncbi:hypothetical protein DFJ77DRAFT_356626 [Powellomyces hirtus]|nr:hypothetical protein DFJ77DRAFT_356626 [Powellomyces hirtus]
MRTQTFLLIICLLLWLWLTPPGRVGGLYRDWLERDPAPAMKPDTWEQTPCTVALNFNQAAARVGSRDPARLFRCLVRGVRSKSDGEGFIYIFQRVTPHALPTERQHWKIGCTSARVGVKKRLNQWEKQCKQKLRLIGQWGVKYHMLCENLIHTELKAKGYWLGQIACNCKPSQSHDEWFMGTRSELSEVIRFWQAFVEANY